MVEVIAELGQVAAADHHLFFDHVGKVDFLVAVLFYMELDHPINKGPLESCAFALQDVEAGAGYLDATIEVQDTEALSQVPVGQWIKIELSRLAPGADHQVAGVVFAHGDIVGGKVGEL